MKRKKRTALPPLSVARPQPKENAKEAGKGKEIRMSIHMDDRTVVTNKRELLLWAMEEWHR